MDEETSYINQLTEALSRKASQMEGTFVRSLRSNLDSFEASASVIYKNLVDKGLVQPDPYKHERTVTEITVPSLAPYSNSEESKEIGLRLSNYISQWEFVRNIFYVGLNNLSLRKVTRLMGLIEYIRWTEFSEHSSNQLTRSVAVLMNKFTQRTDAMTGKITLSSVAQLRELTKKLKKDLKAITGFLRERYKYQVRDELLNTMNIDSQLYLRNPQEVMRNVKFEFSHRLSRLGWYKELIQEILEEDYGKNGEQLRKTVLDKLAVTETTVRKKNSKAPDDKNIAIGILKRLTRAGEPIRSSLVKMNENSRILQERKRSFGENFRRILSTLFKKSDNSVMYDIRLKDPLNGVVRMETIDYNRFAEITMKRARTLIGMQDSTSPGYQRALAASTEQLIVYIDKYLAELKDIHKKLVGLDAFFQSSEVPAELKGQMKGCTINLQSLKTAISGVIREMNAFRLKREEAEQLRKLGIED